MGHWRTEEVREGLSMCLWYVLLIDGGGQGSIQTTEKPESWAIISDTMTARCYGPYEGHTNIPASQTGI